MKSYTDLEQSKKLAEILPIESADFHFSANQSLQGYLEKPIWGNSEYADYSAFPCWSLAALIEVLPTIDDGNRNPVICKDIRLNKWHVVYYSTAVEAKIDSGVYDGLVDACYEMILKLHEQKLL